MGAWTTGARSRWPRRVAATITLGLVLGACGGESVPGGAVDLPGAVSSDAAFEEPPDDAAGAPPFTVDLVDDTTVAVESLWSDRPVVLVFTASWCERCADVHREAAAAVAEHGGDVALLAIAPEDDEDAAAYAAELDLGHPVAYGDDELWLNYAVREPPLVALVAPGGRLLRGYPGGPGEGVLAEQLDALVIQSAGGGR